MEIRSNYSPRSRVQLAFPESEGRTKQSHAEESNINIILAKYIKTGILEHVKEHTSNYGFATSDDFHTSMNIILKAQDMFDDLPSATRKKFANRPENFLDFVQDPKNEQEMFDMGLSHTPPAIIEAVSETPSASGSPTSAVAEIPPSEPSSDTVTT